MNIDMARNIILSGGDEGIISDPSFRPFTPADLPPAEPITAQLLRMVQTWQADVTFCYYDRPILFLNWIGGKAALFVLIDDALDHESFLVALMDAADYWLLWDGARDLRSGFLSAQQWYLVEDHSDLARSATRPLAASDISEEWLPAAGAKLR